MENYEVLSSESYYRILGVNRDSSDEDIRRAYRKLALQWHPDKWANNPALSGDAKGKFQKIQEAYSVLSNQNKRMLYDAGLYDPTEDEDEGFCDFMQEMLSLMSQVKDEEKNCTMEDLQTMLSELAQGVDSPLPYQSPSILSNQGCSGLDSPQWFSSPMISNQGCTGRLQQASEPFTQTSSSPGSAFRVFGMSSFCR